MVRCCPGRHAPVFDPAGNYGDAGGGRPIHLFPPRVLTGGRKQVPGEEAPGQGQRRVVRPSVDSCLPPPGRLRGWVPRGAPPLNSPPASTPNLHQSRSQGDPQILGMSALAPAEVSRKSDLQIQKRARSLNRRLSWCQAGAGLQDRKVNVGVESRS